MGSSLKTETAIFAAGCFWGVEEALRNMRGVLSTEAGYTGGAVPAPSYELVCTGTTGHAEAVKVTYDPSLISYEELLRTFFRTHNPTTVNRQGPDIGEQYRSAIFFHTPEQEKSARLFKEKLENSGVWKEPIITQILPAGPFYRAEEYHQQYLCKRGLSSCSL